MMERTASNVAALVANAVVGYIAYLFTVPAVVLQASTLVLGVGSAFAIALSTGPAWVNGLAVSALTALGLNHVSYSGNPIPALLRWYFLAALVLDVVGMVLARLFPAFTVRRTPVFLALAALDAAACALFAALFLADGASPLPAIILFLITILATALAFGANAIRRAIAKAITAQP